VSSIIIVASSAGIVKQRHQPTN